jgi:hypothetical protein
VPCVNLQLFIKASRVNDGATYIATMYAGTASFSGHLAVSNYPFTFADRSMARGCSIEATDVGVHVPGRRIVVLNS